MAWLAICLPLMIIGIAIATVPIIYAMHHQHRYGMDVKPRPDTQQRVIAPGIQNSAGWTVCSDCSTIVVDPEDHARALHQLVMT